MTSLKITDQVSADPGSLDLSSPTYCSFADRTAFLTGGQHNPVPDHPHKVTICLDTFLAEKAGTQGTLSD